MIADNPNQITIKSGITISLTTRISPRTIRYYEEIGLLKEAKRKYGNYRVYDEEDYTRLKFIRKLKILGLKLSQIQELERLYRVHKENKKYIPRLLEMFDEKVAYIDEKIGSLQSLKEDILSYKKKLLEIMLEE
jgi:DNA-binding transcriptional MerR regulator